MLGAISSGSADASQSDTMESEMPIRVVSVHSQKCTFSPFLLLFFKSISFSFVCMLSLLNVVVFDILTFDVILWCALIGQ
jgi:hypothetical protein